MNVECVVQVVSHQVSCDLGEEAAILNLKSGVYYGLDPVGARIWSLLKEPKTIAQIRDIVIAEFDVTVERCEADLQELLEKLAEAGLIETHEAQAI